MRAVILAAGCGSRLQQAQDRQLPKCLLRFGGPTLLQRHLHLLKRLGSVLTVHTVAEAMTRGGDILLMDADVLYDERILTALVAGRGPVNRLLIDRDFEAGDEPVKVCMRDGLPIEMRKQIPPELKYDFIGESVGFFRFDEAGARRLAVLAAAYVEGARTFAPHEEALRDLLLERSQIFDVADVTGAPWIEIDFPDDVARASLDVLPQLQPLPPA